jgi:tRNA(Ile)-lysidine synthase
MLADPVELALQRAADLLPRGACVLAACSGGPDSVALAAALAASAEALGIRVAIGHVDHALRAQSAQDAEHVRELALTLALPFHHHRLEGLEVAELGLEGAAREARYAVLARLATDAGADRVATAHTRRDQAETVLLRLARGGGAGALAGVRRQRPLTDSVLLVRPLLDVPRQATEAYCAARGLCTVEDAHNVDPRRARARLRDLMPRLAAALNPRLEEALAGAARIAAEEDELLDAQARSVIEGAALDGGFATAPLAALHPALLRRALLLSAQGHARPERSHLEQLAAFVAAGRMGRLDLPGGRAVLEAGALRYEAGGPPLPLPSDVRVPGPGVYRWAGRELRVGAGAQSADQALAPFPWTVRTRLPGDRFRAGTGRAKKLGDLWQAAGIPASRRKRAAVLADAGGRVFWVEGLPPGPACASPGKEAVRFEFGPEMDALR